MRSPEAPEQYNVSSISLRLRHPNANVGELLKKWGFSVGRAWVAGDKRTTGRGKPLDGIWPDSYAYADLEFPEGLRLSASLSHVIEGLAEVRSEIATFVEEGGYAELFVGWIFEGNSGDQLDWKLLDSLANIRLALSLDIYP